MSGCRVAGPSPGAVTEWPKVHDWKSCVPQGTEGSTPSRSAIRTSHHRLLALWGQMVSYLALARKYRPRAFADMVGQEHVVRTLQNSITMDRVHHAFLFTGARGVGKTTTARILAAALNAEAGPSIEPPEGDSICLEIAGGRCPDVLEIDGASNNGVDHIRDLRDSARFLPSRARYKLYIIDEVHMLSKEAFNALLKILEEPPAHVKFIFATTEPQKIPVTILSRCQRFDFRKVSVGQLTNHLKSILEKEELGLGAQALHAVVREAQGSVRDAMSLLDQVLSFAGGTPDDAQVIEALGIVDRQTIFEVFQAIIDKNADAILGKVDHIDRRGHDLADVCTLLVEHVRDLMVFKSVKEPAKVLLDRSPGELDNLSSQAEACGTAQLHRMFALIVDMTETVTHSAFQRVSLEMGLLKLVEVEPAARVQDLVARIDKLLEDGGTSLPGKSEARPAQSQIDTGSVEVQVPSPAKPLAVVAGNTTLPPPAETAPRETGPPESAPLPPDHQAAEEEARQMVDAEAREEADTGMPAPPPGCSGGHAKDESLGDTLDKWRTLVTAILQDNPFVGSILEHARLVRFELSGVTLGFAETEGFFYDGARQPANNESIVQALNTHFEASVELRLVRLELGQLAAYPSLAELKESEVEQELSAIEQETRADPRLKEALSILGGEIKSVVTLKTEG